VFAAACAIFVPNPITGPVASYAQANAKIIGVHYDSAARLDISVPGIEFWTDTLFSDGTACRNCFSVWAISPGQLAELKRRKPADFGTWRAVGNDHQITYPDASEPIEYAARAIMQPLPSDARLDVVLENAAGSDSDIYPDFFGYIRFTKNGQFGLFSDPTKLVGGGEYRIDGYRIALMFQNGQTKLFSLARDPVDDNFLIIDGTGFYTPKSTQ
jgi:hypothetical protein